MHATVRSMTTKRDLASHDIDKHCKRLQRVGSEETFHLIRRQIHELNSRIYESLKSAKERKFAELCGKRRHQPVEINSSNTQCDHDYQSKLVVTIPDDLPLAEAEKSVLSKGLTIVPVKKSTDEHRVKADCGTLYCRVRLHAHFHNGEERVSPKPHGTLVTHLISCTTKRRPGHHQRVNSKRLITT